MSDGFVALYTSSMSRNEVTAVLASLEVAGLRLENELTAAITILSEEGDQVRVDRDHLVQILADLQPGQRATFQLWLSESVDVVSSHMRLARNLTVQRFSLDGLVRDEREFAIAAIASQVGKETLRTVAFAVDRRGAAADFDLDAFIGKGAESVEAFAGELLLVRPGS